MTLERIRGFIEPLTVKIGSMLAKVEPNPDAYTIFGLILAWIAPLASLLDYYWVSLLMIALSAFIDVIDGAVARVSNRTSRRGEFLDSVSDRLSDTAYFLALAVAGLKPSLLLLGLGLAVSISYVRAKGELVGVEMRGIGVMERGDRVLWILFVFALYIIGYNFISLFLLYLGIILLIITLFIRIYRVWSELNKSNNF